MKNFKDKKYIEELIECRKYKEAWEKLSGYKLKYKHDVNFYSLSGLLYILEGKTEKAVEILLDGCNIELSYDILYELGMAYEILDKKLKSIEYYIKAMDISCNDKSLDDLKNIIDNLNYNISEDIINEKLQLDEFIYLSESLNLNIDKYLKYISMNKYPNSIIIETIRGCNLECVFCPLQVDKNVKEHGLMQDELFYKILQDIVSIKNIKTFFLHNLGEPLLDKKIFNKINLIKSVRKDSEVIIDSNLSVDFDAFELVKSGLDVLEVAFDGAYQKNYSKYRKKGNLDKVISNMTRLSVAKRVLNTNKPIINSKTVLFKHVMQELNLISDISAQCGADNYIMQTAIFREETEENPKEWIPEDQGATRYNVKKLYDENKLRFYKNNFEQEKNCSGILTDIPIVIDFKGNVYPCCYSCTNEEYNMGNINEKSFKDIWESDKYVEFRVNVLKNRFKYNMCAKCYRPSNKQ